MLYIFLFLDPAQFQEEIKKKDEQLLTLLKDVYVDSRDPSMNVSQPSFLKYMSSSHLEICISDIKQDYC